MHYVRLNIRVPVEQHNAVSTHCQAVKAATNLQVSFSNMVKSIVFDPARRRRVQEHEMDHRAEKAMICVPLTLREYETLRAEARVNGISAAALVRTRLHHALQ
ncbi:TPA: hypothetical protein ACGW3G_000915 [Stenotrophomonas maltophilia]